MCSPECSDPANRKRAPDALGTMRNKTIMRLENYASHPSVSILAFPSRSSYGIMCHKAHTSSCSIDPATVSCEESLLWIQTKLPDNAPCLDSSRFCPSSRQVANTASCSVLRKVDSSFLSCLLLPSYFVSTWHTGLDSGRPCMHPV